jgi:TM2 domain-containing protein
MVDNGTEHWLGALRTGRGISSKDWNTCFALSVCLGFLGADRFYLGYTRLAWWKLLSFGGFFVWWLVDIVKLLFDDMRDSEGNLVSKT